MDVRQALQMRVMTRKRYKWDIACDTDVQDFFDDIWQLRRYFYSIDEQLEFIKRAENHEHSSKDSSNLYHDDYHDGLFHTHF